MKNVMKLVKEFEREIKEEEIEKKKEKQRVVKIELNPEAEEFKRGELLGRYMAKLLYGWDNGKFEKEYLKKLERN